MNKKLMAFASVFLIGVLIWVLPHPDAIQPAAWQLLAIFIAIIVGFIVHPVPVGAIAFIGLTVAAATNTLQITDVLSGFGNPTVWLISGAFFFSRSFQKTGLGRRISFVLIKLFGSSSLKLLYSMLISDLIIAPVTPSNTARAGGMFFPIVRSLSESFGSYPGPTAKKVGRFLIQGMFHGDNIISGLYMTAMAGNPLMVAFVGKISGAEITWGSWFIGSLVPMLAALIIIPLFLYWFEVPEIKKTPEAKMTAMRELEAMGPMKREEKWLLFIFILALVLWATAQWTKINATTVVVIAVSLMLLTHVLDWPDVTGEKNAWDVLIWMGGLMCLAGFLSKLGLIPYFAEQATLVLGGLSWPIALTLVLIVYVLVHYFFASIVAHIAALFAAFYAVTFTLGAPPYLAAFLLIFATTSMQSLTHYSVGGAPIYFGAGYMSQARWWRNGFCVTMLDNIIFIGIGLVWLKVLGFW